MSAESGHTLVGDESAPQGEDRTTLTTKTLPACAPSGYIASRSSSQISYASGEKGYARRSKKNEQLQPKKFWALPGEDSKYDVLQATPDSDVHQVFLLHTLQTSNVNLNLPTFWCYMAPLMDTIRLDLARSQCRESLYYLCHEEEGHMERFIDAYTRVRMHRSRQNAAKFRAGLNKIMNQYGGGPEVPAT